MPIYEYRCDSCGQVSELLMLGKDESPACQGCGSADLTKLMSAHNTVIGSSSAPQMADCSSCGSQDGCGAPGMCGAPGSCCSN
jgi:putative FmdB family regulatory protein